MSIQLTVPPKRELKPRITVIGVGGAGGNAVNNMIKAGLEGVDFVVANTDAQALAGSNAERRIQMGAQLTEGLGAGSDPSIGCLAAEEAIAEIIDQIQGSHMVFVTAGMGGGTGTGAAPVIAKACREQGILTIGVVTKPFEFEGPRRMRSADIGIAELTDEVDTLIVIPNQNLFRVANEQTGFVEAFAIADEVLHSGVASVTDLMTKPGLINLDFADVKMVMNEMGKAMMGTGEATGENRAIEAAEAAIANPLLEDDSMQGATGVLINITGGNDMTLYEVDEAANRIKREVFTDANIIIGSIFDDSLDGVMRVSVVATGIATEADQNSQRGPRVVHLSKPEASPAELQAEQDTATQEVPVQMETDSIPVTDAPVQAEGETGENVPEFLKPPQAPVARPLPQRKQSFLDRVLRGKKESDTPKAVEKRIEKRVAPTVEERPVEPPKLEEVAEVKEPVTKTTPLDLEDAPVAATVAETKSASEMVSAAEEQPQAIAEDAPMAKMAKIATELDVSEMVEVVLETKEPAKLMPETPAEVKAETTVAASVSDEVSETQNEPVMEAAQATVSVSDVAVPSAQIEESREVPSETPMQETTQTSMQTSMSSGGYDDAQLDIPAFLRRS